MRIHVALAGNPNTGKSTIFNALTGSRQHVGNWPGKTIARRAGYFNHQDTEVEVVDLPGAYSLSPYSPDEQIARDYIVEGKPDVVINVIDAANLERNLYLTTQILETGTAVIVVLNMRDLVERHGCYIDEHKLSQLLGNITIVPTVANKGQGLAQLRQAILHVASHGESNETSRCREENHVNGALKFHHCHIQS